MKYFGIIDKNVAAIFQLQWKIGNISDMFLQYSVLCGYSQAIYSALNLTGKLTLDPVAHNPDVNVTLNNF